MKTAICLVALLCAGSLCAQVEKGVTPVSKPGQNRQVTRAVVCGVSNYQHPNIPDLRYADRDAEAFASFLRSPAGGALDDDHLKLILNEQATTAQFDAALGWLLDESQPGDQAIIYFSGHGDVETKTRGQQGFLLFWDSPPNAYISGAYPIFFLKEMIATLSVEKKIRVLIITDACRSGNLAGSQFGGAQLTSQNLAQQFANEIKILSCQPNEYSLEGDQWGGGRGAFSYHLVDGLYGMADGNSDAAVNLLEIRRYLEDHVTPEVAPHSQVPMTVGNPSETLAEVFPELLSQIRKRKEGAQPVFSSADNRGIEEEVLATVDSTIREVYFRFKQSLKDKAFFEPAEACAEVYYNRLMAEPKLTRLHASMTRNYAAALQDDAQQVINRMLFSPVQETPVWFSPERIRRNYGPYPRLLDRAASLLGKDHYMYPVLMARKAFFEGGIISLQKVYFKDLITGADAIEKFRESIRWQPQAAHTYLWMGMAYVNNMAQRDSAFYYIDKAIELAPAWNLPKYYKINYLSGARKFDTAKTILDTLTTQDSTQSGLWNAWGYWYFFQGNYESTVQVLDKEIANSGDSIIAMCNKILPLGFLGRKQEAIQAFEITIAHDSTSGFPYYFLGNMYYLSGDLNESVIYFSKALEKDPSMTWAYSHLGDALIRLGKYDEAEKILNLGWVKDSTYMPLVNALGGAYRGKKDLVKAEAMFLRAIELDGSYLAPYYNLASIYAETGRSTEAIEYLNQSIRLGMRNFDQIQKNTSFDPLRELPEYKALMKKYFPNKVKEE